MSSLLSATTTIHTTTPIPKHINRAQVLSFLHDAERMIRMNPLITSVVPLPESSSEAFYKSVPREHQPHPARTTPVPVYSVTEDKSVETPEQEAAGSWRGGWASKFIPDKIQLEIAIEPREDGMRALTHAALGVTGMTLWTIKELGDGLVVEKEGAVTSNRMLMSFISTTLKESHEKLADDFVPSLLKYLEEVHGKD